MTEDTYDGDANYWDRVLDTVTIDEIPKDELNEWGYPIAPLWNKNRTALLKSDTFGASGWEFRGFIDGASRWMWVGGEN